MVTITRFSFEGHRLSTDPKIIKITQDSALEYIIETLILLQARSRAKKSQTIARKKTNSFMLLTVINSLLNNWKDFFQLKFAKAF